MEMKTLLALRAPTQARWMWYAALLPLVLSACAAAQPTPYQPLGDNGGYEETRLQDRVWRVSFRGNRYTPESEVVNFLYLRCAQLTRQSGYPYFVIEQNFGRTQTDIRNTGPRFGLGMGFGMGAPDSMWGMGFGATSPSDYQQYVAYHLAMFVIRMLTAEEAKKVPKAFNADYLIRSLTPEMEKSLEHKKT